jgi:hypothetical protein
MHSEAVGRETETSRAYAREGRVVHGISVALCLLFVSCGSSTPQAKAPEVTRTPLPLESLLPLVDDTVSQFELIADGGEGSTFVLEIGRPRAELAELRIAGRVQRLVVERDRVRHATGGSLLELPLTVGHSFRGSFGVVTITRVNHAISVPAGAFEGCLTTVEESQQPTRRVSSVYCPALGLVSLSIEDLSSGGQLLENRLIQHGPRFQ